MNSGCIDAVSGRDPLGRATQADLAEDFAPLGIRLRFETNSPRMLEYCRDAFGRNGFPGLRSQIPQFVIRLLVDPSFTEVPPWPEPVFRGQEAFFYVCVGSQNTALADLRRRYAFGFISPGMAEDADVVRRAFIECLTYTMATHGPGATRTYVHASGVVKGNAGLIFSGPRESGKTTLAYACARRGFQILADDVVYLDEQADGLTAWGLPRRLRFLPDCDRLFPELRRVAGERESSQRDAIEIDVEQYLPGHTRTCCEPAALFFLERSAGPLSCDTLEPDRALRLLARDLIQDVPETMEKHRHAWLRLALKGAYILRYGGEDLNSVVELLEQFL
ncbi:MAG TPA: hypothetical protein VE398_23870 [Acidobacteriota bacterium]|nr:hypothetical protein [Acidobacteriota bacterium]